MTAGYRRSAVPQRSRFGDTALLPQRLPPAARDVSDLKAGWFIFKVDHFVEPVLAHFLAPRKRWP